MFETIAVPILGMDDREATVVDEGKSPYVQNIRTHRNRLQKRPGSLQWGYRDDDPNMSGPSGSALVQVYFPDGSRQALLLTTAGAYRRGVGGETWTKLTEANAYTIAFDRFSVANILEKVYWTSLENAIREYDGSATPALLTHDLNSGGFLGAICLLGFSNRLIAVNTKEVSTYHPYRVRWCANGDVSKWDPATEGAGFIDVRETTMDPLTGGFVLGDRAYVTKHRYIHEVVATGDATAPFDIPIRIAGTGMVSPHSWAGADYFGFFLGNDNVYLWDGASLKGVGDSIYKSLTADVYAGTFLQYTLANVQGIVIPEDSEYWLLPGVGDKVYVYDYKRDRWFIDVWHHNINCMGTFFKGSDWIDTAAQVTSQFAALNFSTGISQVNRAYLYDEELTTYNGRGTRTHVAIDAYAETKDQFAKALVRGIPVPTVEKLNTLRGIQYHGEPKQKVEVGWSRDRGGNWIAKWDVVGQRGAGHSHMNVPFSTIRFRLRNNNADEDLQMWGIITYEWKSSGPVPQGDVALEVT